MLVRTVGLDVVVCMTLFTFWTSFMLHRPLVLFAVHSRLMSLYDIHVYITCLLKGLVALLCHTSQVSCTGSEVDKFIAQPFPSSESLSTSLFEIVHFDIWGPTSVCSRFGY